MFAGSIASATVLGAPDLVVLTLTEKGSLVRRRVETAKRTCEKKITARMKPEQIEQVKQGLRLLVGVL